MAFLADQCGIQVSCKTLERRLASWNMSKRKVCTHMCSETISGGGNVIMGWGQAVLGQWLSPVQRAGHPTRQIVRLRGSR